MKTITKRVFAIAGVLALGLTAVKAQTDSALLDALVKKAFSAIGKPKTSAPRRRRTTPPRLRQAVHQRLRQEITFYGDGASVMMPTLKAL